MRRALHLRAAAPYLLLLPGLLWLIVFYVYPAFQMFLTSLWTGNLDTGYQQTWNWGIYQEAITEYWPWLARSIIYGGLATEPPFPRRGPPGPRAPAPRRAA